MNTADWVDHGTRESSMYLSTLYPKVTIVQWTLRSHGHCNLPNFVGRWFPRSDDEETRGFYCVSMLALPKPWRNLGKNLGQTWETVSDHFLDETSYN